MGAAARADGLCYTTRVRRSALRILRLIIYAGLFLGGIGLGGYLLIQFSFLGTNTAVPLVVGLTEDQASWQASRSHLQFAVRTERYDLKASKGTVISQTPGAGMTVRRGMTLQVIVSKGIESLAMPNLLGMRMDEAQLQIQQSGLRWLNTAYVHAPASSSTIVAQEPPPGQTVPRDADVSVLVSLGPPSLTFVMPYLVGLNAQSAKDQLQAYGIQFATPQVGRTSGAQPDTVLGQNPGPGMPLHRTDLVQLTVSQP